MIIGLTGASGCGKSTAAEILQGRFGYRILSMADAVRSECAHALLFPPADIVDEELSDIIHNSLCTGFDLYAKPTPFYARRMLQIWGTEYRRRGNPDYWVKIMRARLQRTTAENVVIPDIRFRNEAEMLHFLHGEVWCVQRESALPVSTHASEEFCRSDYPWDLILDNNGELNRLRNVLINRVLSAPARCYAKETNVSSDFSFPSH